MLVAAKRSRHCRVAPGSPCWQLLTTFAIWSRGEMTNRHSCEVAAELASCVDSAVVPLIDAEMRATWRSTPNILG